MDQTHREVLHPRIETIQIRLCPHSGETGGVERGAVASIGLDYLAVGRIAGNMAADILEGAEAGQIDAVIAYEVSDEFKVVVNLGAAEKMGVKIPDSILARATQIIE